MTLCLLKSGPDVERDHLGVLLVKTDPHLYDLLAQLGAPDMMEPLLSQAWQKFMLSMCQQMILFFRELRIGLTVGNPHLGNVLI